MLCPEDWIRCLPLVLSTDHARCGVRCNTLRAHRLGEVLSPLTQHWLVDVQSLPEFAFGFHDHVDVGIRLIRIQVGSAAKRADQSMACGETPIPPLATS